MAWTNVEWAHGEDISDFASRANNMDGNCWHLLDAARNTPIIMIPEEMYFRRTFYGTDGGLNQFARVKINCNGANVGFDSINTMTYYAESGEANHSYMTDEYVPAFWEIDVEVMHPDTGTYYNANYESNWPRFYFPMTQVMNRITWRFDAKYERTVDGDDITIGVYIKNFRLGWRYYASGFAGSDFDHDEFGEGT